MVFNTLIFILAVGLGPWEIGLIILAIIFLFGAKKIPDLARGIGKGIREFKDASRGDKNDLDENVREEKSKKF